MAAHVLTIALALGPRPFPAFHCCITVYERYVNDCPVALVIGTCTLYCVGDFSKTSRHAFAYSVSYH